MTEYQIIDISLFGKFLFWIMFIAFIYGMTRMSDYKDPACGWVGHQ